MDKVKLNYKEPEPRVIHYRDTSFLMYPVLSNSQQVFLISRYIEDYFSETEEHLIKGTTHHVFDAEFNLKMGIIQILSNIDASELNAEIFSDSEFWDIVYASIDNYPEFEKFLKKVLEDELHERRHQESLPMLVYQLLERGYDVLEQLAKISPEQIGDARRAGMQMLDALKESSLLAPDATPVVKSRKKKAPGNGNTKKDA